MTKIEIIDETVEFYRTHPRSVNANGECRYVGPNGERCAFARCISNPEKMKEGRPAWVCMRHDGPVFLDGYEGHTHSFWSGIQNLHDRPELWTANESGGSDLTEAGRRFVSFLKESYANES